MRLWETRLQLELFPFCALPTRIEVRLNMASGIAGSPSRRTSGKNLATL